MNKYSFLVFENSNIRKCKWLNLLPFWPFCGWRGLLRRWHGCSWGTCRLAASAPRPGPGPRPYRETLPHRGVVSQGRGTVRKGRPRAHRRALPSSEAPACRTRRPTSGPPCLSCSALTSRSSCTRRPLSSEPFLQHTQHCSYTFTYRTMLHSLLYQTNKWITLHIRYYQSPINK